MTEEQYKELDNYRLDRRMSYAALAAEIGIPVDTLRRAILGKHQPRLYNLVQIRRYYRRHVAGEVPA